MLPTTQVPVLRPTPTLSGMNGRPPSLASCSRAWLSSSTRSSMSSAASQALTWCSLSSSGAFQNAMMASPIYLSMVPLRLRIALVSGVRKRFISAVRPCGSLLVGLRDRGEAAHVGEHDGHLALLAAEHELFRRLRELLDQRRRQILAEGRADLPALRLLAHEAREDQREVDRRGRHQRIGEIDQQPVLRVEDTTTFRSAPAANAAPSATSVTGPNMRREDDDQQPEQQRGDEFDRDAVVRLRDHARRSARSPAPGHGSRRRAWRATPAWS